MKAVLVVVAMLLCCGAASAEIPLERAGVAYVSPITSSGEALTALVFNFKVLPIEEPEAVSVRNPLSLLQYAGAKVTLDALIYNDEGSLPTSFDNSRLAPGASLPLLTLEGDRSDFRGGVTYTQVSKLGAYLSLGYQF